MGSLAGQGSEQMGPSKGPRLYSSYRTEAEVGPFLPERHGADPARYTESGAVGDLKIPEEHPERDHQGRQKILFTRVVL